MPDSAHDQEFVTARETLLMAVEKAAEDLELFHDTVENADVTIDASRASVADIQRVVDDLTRLEKDLERVLLTLGLGPGNVPR